MSSLGGSVLFLIFGFSFFFIAHVQGLKCYKCNTPLNDEDRKYGKGAGYCMGDQTNWETEICRQDRWPEKCSITTMDSTTKATGERNFYQWRSCTPLETSIEGCIDGGDGDPLTKRRFYEECRCDTDLCNGDDRPTASTEKPGKSGNGKTGNGKTSSDASTILLGGLGKGFFILIGALFLLLGLE